MVYYPTMVKLSDVDLLQFGHSVQLVGAVYEGGGRAFLVLFPEDQAGELPTIERLDMGSDEWVTFLQQTDVLNTQVQARAQDGTIQKAILRKSQRQIDSTIQWKVFKRDSYRCRYCGNDSVPLTVDHLVCWEAGGPSIEANLVASCKKDNRVRSNTPYEEWLRHPHYLRVSKGLTEEVRRANEALVATLTGIPRLNYVKSR